jgi:hypothetical protein
MKKEIQEFPQIPDFHIQPERYVQFFARKLLVTGALHGT